jgi:hypothetical protein
VSLPDLIPGPVNRSMKNGPPTPSASARLRKLLQRTPVGVSAACVLVRAINRGVAL